MNLLMRWQLWRDRLVNRPIIVKSRPGTPAEMGFDEHGRRTLADGRVLQILPTSTCGCDFCRSWGDWPS
jgi:hypothetical protein